MQKTGAFSTVAETEAAPFSPGWSRWGQATRIVVLAGFPASLLSAGATISLALAVLFGLAMLIRDRDFPDDLKTVLRMTLSLYVFVVILDVMNGGSLASTGGTAFNYLMLPALPLYAYTLRKLNIGPNLLDPVIWITLTIGVFISIGIAYFEENPRPGGIDMDALSYGYVLVVWLLFVFSRALEGDRYTLPLILLALLSTVVLLYAQTKIHIAMIAVGLFTIGTLWVMETRRWGVFIGGVAITVIPFCIFAYHTTSARFAKLWRGLEVFLTQGQILQDDSFGGRVGQIVAGWQAFLDKPILGHGLAEAQGAVGEYFAPSNPAWDVVRIHNDFIVHLVAFGAPGMIFLAGYLVMAVAIMKKASCPAYRRAGIALVITMPMLMTAYIIFNMSPMSGLITLAMGAVLSTPLARRG